MIGIYDLHPITHDCYIAPSATVIGEVYLDKFTSVWNNVVIRGDLNAVDIHQYVTVGDGTVIQTVASLATGLEAKVDIRNNVTIGPNCNLISCFIDEDVIIGANCTIMEGARIEARAHVLPGTVVPPGRLVPAGM